jgi:hypothetical protein
VLLTDKTAVASWVAAVAAAIFGGDLTVFAATPTAATTTEHQMVTVLGRWHPLSIECVMISVDGLRNCAGSLMMNIAWRPWPSTRHTSATGLTAFLMPFMCFRVSTTAFSAAFTAL